MSTKNESNLRMSQHVPANPCVAMQKMLAYVYTHIICNNIILSTHQNPSSSVMPGTTITKAVKSFNELILIYWWKANGNFFKSLFYLLFMLSSQIYFFNRIWMNICLMVLLFVVLWVFVILIFIRGYQKQMATIDMISKKNHPIKAKDEIYCKFLMLLSLLLLLLWLTMLLVVFFLLPLLLALSLLL